MSSNNKDTILIGVASGRIIDVQEATKVFPNLKAVLNKIEGCAQLQNLFPTPKFFANYLNELSKLTLENFKSALEQISETLYDGRVEFESEAEEEMWDDISNEEFAEVISTNFQVMYKQFLKDIGK